MLLDCKKQNIFLLFELMEIFIFFSVIEYSLGGTLNMMTDKLAIRLMNSEDLEAVALLYTNVYDTVDIGEKWTKETSYLLMEYWLARQPDLCFVSTIDNRIVGGFVAGIKPWWDGNHLVDGEVFVDFDYHQQKIGTELSKAIYKTALKKYQITSIDLVTFSKNGFPLSWYKKLNFVIQKQLIIISGDLQSVIKKLK